MNDKVLDILKKYYHVDEIKKLLISSTDDFSSLLIDLSVSNNCNLKCKHCYYGKSLLSSPTLITKDWKSIIDYYYSHGCRHFHFSGKESSLDYQTITLLKYIKFSYSDTYCGVITNGTGTLEYYSLLSNHIDYIEISVDGLQKEHDFLRGKGVFNRVFQNLTNLQKIMDSSKINLSTSFYTGNIDSYVELIGHFSNIGIKKYFGTPIILLGNAISIRDKLISQQQFSQVIQETYNLIATNNLNINVFFCIPHEMILDFWNNDLFIHDICDNYLKSGDELIVKVNESVLQFSIDFFDIPFLKQICITSNGFFLPKVDVDYDLNFKSFNLGNFNSNSFEDIMEYRKHLIINSI